MPLRSYDSRRFGVDHDLGLVFGVDRIVLGGIYMRLFWKSNMVDGDWRDTWVCGGNVIFWDFTHSLIFFGIFLPLE